MYFIRFMILFLPIIIYAQSINVAVIAHHGIKQAQKDWMPTVNYLDQKIPEHHFKLVPFLPTQFPNLKKEVKAGKIDFIISPPAMYVELELTAGASKMLTLVQQNNIAQFGSVIFASKKSNIKKISQINSNTRIAAVAPLGFGGWLIGYNELKDHHIPINEKDVDFLGTQENVVKAILSNKADVGIVRTGILEQLQSKKEIDLKNITVLHQQIHENFPFICSSELYPEWAFARTKHVDNNLAKKVVLALLSLSKDSNITKSSDYIYHWTVPYDYQNVRELMQRLEVGYYANLKSEIVKKWIKQHEETIFFITSLVILILFLSYIREYVTNRKLTQEITKETQLREDLKDKEEVMIAQSRHAAMGEMISMIAHQWRQPLSIIAMDANNIMADIELDMVNKKTLQNTTDNILNQTKELSKTIDDFKNFFKPLRIVEEVFPADIFDETFNMVGKSLQINKIQLIRKFNSKKKIQTYSRELMQVLINIIKNAKEALVENNIENKKITILITDNTDNVTIEICDNAGGIPKDIIEKIFDPYFTTKKKINGTGLGLYMSKIIIDKHLNGTLNAYNNDEGACFEIVLPFNIEKTQQGV